MSQTAVIFFGFKYTADSAKKDLVSGLVNLESNVKQLHKSDKNFTRS